MTSNETSTGHAGDSPKAHYGKLEDPRLSAEQMDERRKQNVAYEYLCHLEETKVWLEACLVETLPQTIDLEEGLRNGVFLGKLAHFMTPDLVPIKKIYDRDQTRFKARGLHFRHTDNINHWLRAMERMGLPKIFAPETTDIYDRKNMPRTIYCIHALSLYLFKLGKAPQIQDLYGKVNFTDEEISAMRMELEKYGIQMPAFSKIGGILANEMPVDEAALHAAVIAINDSVDHQQAEITLVALQNPAAHLGNIYVDLSETYQDILFEAKTMKTDIARNKSLDPGSSYIPDAYDELLTQAEIQGNINKVNVVYALGCLHDAVENRDEKGMVKSLLRPQLMIRDVRKSVAPLYLSELLQAIDNKMHNNNEEDRMLNKDEVQAAIYSANVKADKQGQKSEVVKLINSAIEEREQQVLLGALQMPEAQLPAIQPAAAPLYFNELVNMKEEKQAPLDYDEITGGLEVLTAVAFVNETVKSGNPNMTYQALSQEEAHVHSLDDDCKSRYQQALVDAKFKKEKDNSGLLTHSEVQHCVDEVNNQVLEENDRITAVEKINEAVDAGDAEQTIIMLKLPAAQLDMVADAHATQYQVILTQAKSGKAEETKDPTASLWYEEIKNAVNFVNKQAADGKELSLGVIAINIAVDAAEENALLKCLQNEDVGLHSLTQQCKTAYLNKLSAFKTKKTEAGNSGSGWIMNRLREGHKFYFNYITMEYAFDRPSNIKKDHSLLSKEEIQSCINEVTSSYDRQLLYKANQRFIVQLQAYARGYLVRKRFTQRRCYLSSTAPSVVKLQSWWRMIQEKRNYQDRLGHLHSQEKQTLQIQAAVRMYLVRKKYLERMKFLKEKEPVVVKLQSFMRANWAKKDYQTLMHGNNPPLSVVRRFVHLLDIGDLDYTEEIELERLREQLVSEIRSNQHLEGDLNQMDIKIGLLVRNRITLQDVISQHKTLKQYRDKDNETFSKGLKALSKQSRARLEGYQHLFYMLQTNPTYLAKLIFEMPQSRTTKFMESVILTIYNYASNQREEYLLLKLFKTALQEEIRSKVDKMSDIVTGNPMVVKMIVSYNRNTRGQNSLRDLLYPLVRSVIDDHSLLINTNPAEVYKHWVNSTETKTGKVSGLPYDATIEEAMQHEEVQIQIQQSVECLREVTERFLNAILQSIHCIPYGMRYMARVMKEALHEKFPEAPEKDVLKIVGNLIYYRYINSAIVAPDAFDIIDLSANKGLTNDQRRNLGSVAKILQFAASNKGFGGDSAHLSSLNPYIMEAHNKFKKYFRAVCEVEEPEVMFNMDQYTDLVRITKPIIYISIAEIMDTHKSLLEHLEAIASDPEDQIYELIDDLGDVPDVESLLGESGIEDNPANKAQLSKTEISLTLSSKFEVADDEESDTKSLFIRTKRMVVDLIRCQRTGENLIHVLNIPSSEAEEQDHEVLVKRREIMDNKASRKTKLVRQPSLLAETRLPLEGIKEHVRTHLAQLEKLGAVTKQDSYQYLINSIVQDMRNQRLYRQRRKQEVVRLRQTLRSLAAKRSFFEEQVDYYNQYVKTCLDNLSTKAKKSGKKFSLFSRDGKYKAKGSVKYSAARLHEKGVILEIEGLPTNQFKNVLFEITATETQGLFDVSAKLMGVNMEKVELVFQDLLQLQYEGVAVMKMFDKAKINVNLLIFLLNKKFYGK